MSIKIPVYQPSLSGNEKKYVNDCLDSTWISSKGKYINKFESKFADFINVNHTGTGGSGGYLPYGSQVTMNHYTYPGYSYAGNANNTTDNGLNVKAKYLYIVLKKSSAWNKVNISYEKLMEELQWTNKKTLKKYLTILKNNNYIDYEFESIFYYKPLKIKLKQKNNIS